MMMPAETCLALTEASAWRIALAEHDLETSAEFESWLKAAPEHQRAWSEVQSSWSVMGDLADTEELTRLRREALMRAAEAHRKWRRPAWAALAASLLLVVIALMSLQFDAWQDAQPKIFATELAERRVITLDDQSKITLDSNSEIEVRYSEDARKLVLLKGQARFDVAKDPLRPFSVRALDNIVVATGTTFTVDLFKKAVTVTLIEGKVAILKAAPSKQQVARKDLLRPRHEFSLVAGQQLIVSAGAAAPVVQTADVEKSTSWEQGVLMFQDERLASVAARIGRYSEKQIAVDDSVADLRISGVFMAGDLSTFVDAVSRYLPVKARQVPNGVELTRRT